MSTLWRVAKGRLAGPSSFWSGLVDDASSQACWQPAIFAGGHGGRTKVKRESLSRASAVAIGWVLVCFGGSVNGAEGMWQPAQLPELAGPLADAGLKIDPERLSELTEYPMNAVVGLGFCTASFVSPMGLAVTNHHCAYGAIQYNSTAERNLLAEGFLADTLGEELPADPTQRIYVTEQISEVSDRINAGLAELADGKARFDQVDRRSKQIVAECEKGGGVRCDVYVFHGGASFNLVRQLEIRDVRLVHAPAEAIGKFGGDVDNWIWPRHTGDYAFFRAYVGPDGKPADHSESNVPYRPKSHLRVAGKGVRDGDFVMIAGYPGRTNRYRLAREVAASIDWSYPTYIDLYSAQLALIDQASADRPEAAIKYASTKASLNNGLKNFQGNLDGFKRLDVVAEKRRLESGLEAWLKTNPEMAGDYFERAAQLDALLDAQAATRDRDLLWQSLWRTGLLSAAGPLYRLALERSKPNEERTYGYQQRDEVRIQGRLVQLDRRYDAAVDRVLLEDLLQRYLGLPEGQRIAELDRWLGREKAGDVDLAGRLNALYAGTKLGVVDERKRWFTASAAAIEAADDSALQLAVALMPAVLRMEAEDEARKGDEYLLRPAYMRALIAWKRSLGEPVYPDANNSLRVTYGRVEGYTPRDAVSYAARTGLNGLLEKHTGVDPFDATERQLAAIRADRLGSYRDSELGTVPVNFVASLDITGGNSGSPTLNDRAELVGLAFDGNYESISSGWLFNPQITRSIQVDVRYMLWVMDAVDRAHGLIREMGLQPEFE